MKKIFTLAVSILLVNSFYGSKVFALDKTPVLKYNFPEISGKNLENKNYKLPVDFEGKYNLVFIAFLREQQDQIDKWVPLANNLSKKFENLNYYELPVLSESYNLVRWFIDGGMRAGISDKSARERTITIYTNKKRFLKSLNIIEDKDIHILLIDSQGKIVWCEKGSFSENKADSLQTALTDQIGKK